MSYFPAKLAQHCQTFNPTLVTVTSLWLSLTLTPGNEPLVIRACQTQDELTMWEQTLPGGPTPQTQEDREGGPDAGE